METNETFEPLEPRTGISLNHEAQTYLGEAGKWATFLGILGFILCGLLLLGAFSFGAAFSKMAEMMPTPPMLALAGMGGAITVFFLLIDLLYFFFALYLYQFGNRIKKGLMFFDNLHITAGLGKLKSFFKLWGIVTIVVLVFYVLAIVGGIVFAMRAASMMHN